MLVIGEMRTPEVMRLTLNAAETGHLVLATMHSATCAEALTPALHVVSRRRSRRACARSSPTVWWRCAASASISSSAQRLRVPRCEILLPTSGAKGTIRAGNFSQIATVLQSGGEEGMWTFDRYQRWMEQVDRLGAAALGGGAARAGRCRLPRRRARIRAAKASPPRGRLRQRRCGPRPHSRPPSPRSRTPGEEVIEVPAEEMDLAALAELAKKVVERKPT